MIYAKTLGYNPVIFRSACDLIRTYPKFQEADEFMLTQHARLLSAMISYDRGDPRRIQHLVKVYSLASAIGTLEGLDDELQYILETAAILHDIGAHNALAKYGSGSGHYQELEGPSEAERLMREVGGCTEAQIERVKYLVGHHHTYSNIDGKDYQILIEADFLVNLYEHKDTPETIDKVRSNIFRTQTGLKFLDDMFAQEEGRNYD